MNMYTYTVYHQKCPWQIDYFERAKRMVEIPLLTKQYEEQKEKDRQFHDEYEEERVSLAVQINIYICNVWWSWISWRPANFPLQIANAIKERKEAEKTHARLIRMEIDEKNFKKALQERRKVALQVSYFVWRVFLITQAKYLQFPDQLLLNLIVAGKTWCIWRDAKGEKSRATRAASQGTQAEEKDRGCWS